jgi:hypothetical protein
MSYDHRCPDYFIPGEGYLNSKGADLIDKILENCFKKLRLNSLFLRFFKVCLKVGEPKDHFKEPFLISLKITGGDQRKNFRSPPLRLL